MRTLDLILCILLIGIFSVSFAGDSTGVAAKDSLIARTDTVFVIPNGPVAGSMTSQARVAVLDTIAGWARIQIEGWVPYSAIAGRLPGRDTTAVSTAGTKSPPVERQCQAMTSRGKQCKRKAMPGRRYCWQHQK